MPKAKSKAKTKPGSNISKRPAAAKAPKNAGASRPTENEENFEHVLRRLVVARDRLGHESR